MTFGGRVPLATKYYDSLEKRESGIGSKANWIRRLGFDSVSGSAAVVEIGNPTTVDPVPDPACAGMTLLLSLLVLKRERPEGFVCAFCANAAKRQPLTRGH
jgi:hypothetical protein